MLTLIQIILKKCSPLIMLIAIAGTTFSKSIALLDYQLNEKYIASTLCENRGKPACCCHGKCFLKKQLQKDEETGKNKLPFTRDKFESSLFWQETSRNFLQIPGLEKNFSDFYLPRHYNSFLSPVFHPPGPIACFIA
jgi:hypothetical protein